MNRRRISFKNLLIRLIGLFAATTSFSIVQKSPCRHGKYEYHYRIDDGSRRTQQELQQQLQTLNMAGGEGGESEWIKALRDAQGTLPGEFEKEMKMKGFLGKGGSGNDGENKKLSVNAKLVEWLEKQGDVYLREESSWGEAPHPLAISTETIDEATNESSGRGLLARKAINQEDELLRIPLRICFTKKSAQTTFGTDIIDDGMNEYLAMACQLIHEKFVLKEKSFYQPYMDILPTIEEVNPTFTWSDQDLDFLQGSPVIAATKSMQMKLKREYESLFLGTGHRNKNDGNFFQRFPKRFSPEVCFLFKKKEYA